MGNKKHTITAWLHKRISHLDYGYKWHGQVKHCNYNVEVLDHLRNKVYLSHLTNKKLANHFSGEDTFYFAGNSWGDETLVMIDIDCHGVGSLQGALAYAQFLKDTFFPNLYFEPSTNGNGVHGYLVIHKAGVRPAVVNDLLGQLEAYLRQTIGGFDIETVEIKGRCPVIIWGSKRGEVANYKAGMLAKIPRNADRFEELQNTTTLSVNDLRRMISTPLPRNFSPVIRLAVLCESSIIKPVNATKKVISTVKVRSPKAKVRLLCRHNGCSENNVPKVREPKAVTGSCSDKVISKDELEKLHGHYLTVATTLMGVHRIKTGRVVATAKDLALFLLLLKWFHEHMNADGSMPWARFKALWDALYEAGDTDRAFDPKRFAALRNYLSSLGLLDWADATYKQGRWEMGVKVGGQACKWQASEQLMEMLNVNSEEQERGRTSLAGTFSASTPSRLQQIVESLVRLPFEKTIRPVDTTPTLFVMPSEQELRKAMGRAA